MRTAEEAIHHQMRNLFALMDLRISGAKFNEKGWNFRYFSESILC